MIAGSIASFFVPESPRYLYSKKDWPKLYQTLTTFAKWNGVKAFGNTKAKKLISSDKSELLADKQELMVHSEDTRHEGESEKAEYSVLNALRDRRVLINFISVIILFSLVSFNFYLLGFYIKYIGGSIYINMIASAFSDIIGNFSL